ncbi:MAG: hypothetical protein OXC13_12590 [Caldilineaceae bacterium]|nr:hypothetical protein [Caldilineaceae bacterium]
MPRLHECALNSPATVVHVLQDTVASSTGDIPGTITGQEHNNPRVTVVIDSVLQHAQLQPLIRHPLFALALDTPIKEVDLNPTVFHPIHSCYISGGIEPAATARLTVLSWEGHGPI